MDVLADSDPVEEVTTSNIDSDSVKPVEPIMITEESNDETKTIDRSVSESTQSAIVCEEIGSSDIKTNENEGTKVPLGIPVDKEDGELVELQSEDSILEEQSEMMDETRLGEKVTLRRKKNPETIPSEEKIVSSESKNSRDPIEIDQKSNDQEIEIKTKENTDQQLREADLANAIDEKTEDENITHEKIVTDSDTLFGTDLDKHVSNDGKDLTANDTNENKASVEVDKADTDIRDITPDKDSAVQVDINDEKNESNLAETANIQEASSNIKLDKPLEIDNDVPSKGTSENFSANTLSSTTNEGLAENETSDEADKAETEGRNIAPDIDSPVQGGIDNEKNESKIPGTEDIQEASIDLKQDKLVEIANDEPKTGTSENIFPNTLPSTADVGIAEMPELECAAKNKCIDTLTIDDVDMMSDTKENSNKILDDGDVIMVDSVPDLKEPEENESRKSDKDTETVPCSESVSDSLIKIVDETKSEENEVELNSQKNTTYKYTDTSSGDTGKIKVQMEYDDDVIMVESDDNATDSSDLSKAEKQNEKIQADSTSTKKPVEETEAGNDTIKEKTIEGVEEDEKSTKVIPLKNDKDQINKTVQEENESTESNDKSTSNSKPEPLLNSTKPDDIQAKQLEKTIVLDEKLGVFEMKASQPEEKIPQLISGDSDEDVVMIEDDEPTPVAKITPKDAVVGSKPSVKLDVTAPKRISVAESKPTKPKTEKVVIVDCVNPECGKQSAETAPAPGFVLNFYSVPKKSKRQRVCLVCYDEVVAKYSEMCESLLDQQPLLFCKMPQKNELVEISDSSEEEDDDAQQDSGKPLSSDIISLVETELQDVLASTFEKINLSQQIEWTEQIMKQKIAYNAKLSDEINNELNDLQRKVDRIHLNLYSKSRPKYHDLPPCNIFHEVDLINRNQQSKIQSPQNQQPQKSASYGGQSTSTTSLPLSPKSEEFVRPAVVVGQFYFAVKHKLLSNWAECQVVEAVNVSEKTLYKVNFLHNQGTVSAPIKVVPAKFLAYRHSFNVKLPLGTRVIARFDAGTTQPSYKLTQTSKSNSFYPGIIAESFGKYNRHRYLIFFDDGYAQYVSHGDVRVVCEESKEVWLDIHPHSQEFIRNYLLNYRSQRPMVQVKVGQRIITEWKGKWIYAKVIDIDASLVQLHFPEDNRFEWIYRGSTRLGPLYQEKALSMSKMSNNKFSKFQKRNEPSIEYITIDDDENDQNKQDSKKSQTPQEQALQSYQMQNKVLQQQTISQSLADSASNRSVAKKSTFHRAVSTSQPSAVFMNSSTIYCEDDRPKGKIVYYTAKKHLPPLKYKPHECNPNCLFKITHNLKSYSPLAKPLLSGWERQLCKMKYKKVYVVYRAPCGRRLRNMYELHQYLRMTRATLNVENYDFDPMVHCLAEYVIENHIYHNPDLSDGREYMAVPCVNYFDDTKPPPCVYSTERIPTEGVNLNLDSDFMCGCDCEDDCIDKNRCQCWQLTIAGAKFGNPNTSIDNIGYVYKRLQETVVTGIYECNSRCKCNTSCLNRVVQHPLQTKLQVFKTSNRGWGIRCLNDVSKGSFICIYSGHLLTEEAGNMICQMNANKAGDEYFADLDYIETVEQLKEGYETDVVESESEIDSDEPDYDVKRDTDASDDDFTTTCNPSNAVVKTRSQVRRDSTKRTEPKFDKKQKKKDDMNDSDDEREMVSLVPNAEMIIAKEDDTSTSMKYRSVRKLFGKDEKIYIMDAKKSGNLGRYFNHSCNPNLFVQNVFVDTHDLRFPWVAFFALSNIRAGSELTWNYNYDVGSVEGKVLYCQCGAENCRQRLL